MASRWRGQIDAMRRRLPRSARGRQITGIVSTIVGTGEGGLDRISGLTYSAVTGYEHPLSGQSIDFGEHGIPRDEVPSPLAGVAGGASRVHVHLGQPRPGRPVDNPHSSLLSSTMVDSLDWTDTTPLRLKTAAEVAFPGGGMTASGLRHEAVRGRLVVERIAGKDYTTLQAIDSATTLRDQTPSGNGVVQDGARPSQHLWEIYIPRTQEAAGITFLPETSDGVGLRGQIKP
jgi:hypothetical protein